MHTNVLEVSAEGNKFNMTQLTFLKNKKIHNTEDRKIENFQTVPRISLPKRGRGFGL